MAIDQQFGPLAAQRSAGEPDGGSPTTSVPAWFDPDDGYEAFEEYWRQVEKYEEKYFVERENYGNFRDELNALDENPEPGFHNYDPERSPRPY